MRRGNSWEVRISHKLAEILNVFLCDDGVDVPFTDIPFENTSIRFFIPRKDIQNFHDVNVRLYKNNQKNTRSFFVIDKDPRYTLHVLLTCGSIIREETTATIIDTQKIRSGTVILYLNDGKHPRTLTALNDAFSSCFCSKWFHATDLPKR